MKIKKLPVEARSKLQSGIIVTDAVQCVIELVQNSLDAEATGIAVRIDLKNYQIRVIDNGKGIGKDDLELVGERFMTSKYQPFGDMEISVPMYGCSGQALSSLQDVSRSLTIETKPEDEGPTFVKVFQSGKALPIREVDSERNGTGTVVTIEDFMYAMPVRRNRVNEVFDMEEIKNQLQYLAIIHYNVCFTLRNETKGAILLQTPQASSILESVKNLFGKNIASSLKPLNYKDKDYEVSGFISVKSPTQNNLQLIYINRKIITRGVIHKFINNLVKEYNGKESLFTDSDIGQVIKGTKMSPCTAFIVLMTCPRLLCELFTNIRKTTVEFKNWTDALKCVHKAVKGTLKNVSNSNISCTQQDETIMHNEEKRIFGTSLLVNAVRGAPVKRELKCERDTKKRKLKKNCKSFFRNHKFEEVTEKCKTENVIDSIESPIPKKRLRCKNTNYESVTQRYKGINESFEEFYEWLKTKFESDTNAFTLYNDFLQFKSGTTRHKKIPDIKSPILGGRLKRKKLVGPKKKSIEKRENKVLESVTTLEKEIAIATKNQLQVLPNSHLRVARGVQFTTEILTDFPEFLKSGSIRSDCLNFEKSNSQFIFKKPEVSVLSKNQKQVECNVTVSSLRSSEVQFTNVIKFRNLSESFFQQPPNQVSPEKPHGSSTSNTWLSHYQDIVSEHVERLGKENYVSRPAAHKIHHRKNDLKNFHSFYGKRLCVGSENKAKEIAALRDVEVQVEILKVAHPVHKVHATVQTLHAVPETPSFEDSYAFGEKTFPKSEKEEEGGFEFSEKHLSHEVPNPDFWNTSEYMNLEQVANSGFVSDSGGIRSKNRDKTEKNSTSVEFFCGHKSHVSSKTQNEKSVSKENETIAAIWTDTLTEIENPMENGKTTDNLDLNKSKSEHTQLPKTLPYEEIECYMSQPIEPGFRLTERHDIVPKGLSPEFLNPEVNKISALSPREKFKIKLTMETTQNEILANIKWQDESTGDCLKPKIPDGIFFEMNRKIGETAMNYGDPILSATLSYCAVKVHNLLHSFTYTKELLSDVEILGQLDRKFIVTKIKLSTPKKMELLSLFDQHAVDERIKLEELIGENTSPGGNFISSCLSPSVECKLDESEVRVASEFAEKILSFGLRIEPVNRNTLLVTHAPSFLLTKHEKDLKSKKGTSLSDILKSLIVNILEEVTKTRGAGSKIPKVLHNAFCLEACHKAIKFNKALSVEKMTEMINKLQKCTLPFQCAHGRPSVIPVIDLEDFKPAIEERETVDLQKLKKFLNERREDDIIRTSEIV